MTATTAIGATVLCYAVLGVLLLSLNFASLWRWWVKAAAILVTVLACIGSYFSISGLLGWPATTGMPARFNLLATRIIEPDAARNEAGHIYLWAEPVDENQIIVGPPRAFEVPYMLDLARSVDTAQDSLDEGSSILGEVDAPDADSPVGEQQAQDETETGAAPNGTPGGPGNGEGARFDGPRPTGNLSFSDMPPVSLPSKAPID